MNVLSTFVRSEVYLVLHDEVCLSGAEVEGGLFELLALVAVRQQERGGHQVGPQVVDQELLALGLEGRAVVLVRKEETCGDGLQGQLGCQRLLALLLHRGHLQVQDDWLNAYNYETGLIYFIFFADFKTPQEGMLLLRALASRFLCS